MESAKVSIPMAKCASAEVRSLCNSMSDPLFGHRDGLYLGASSDTAHIKLQK